MKSWLLNKILSGKSIKESLDKLYQTKHHMKLDIISSFTDVFHLAFATYVYVGNGGDVSV